MNALLHAAFEATPAPLLQPLQERILVAAAQRQPLRLCGQGSKEFYGNPSCGEALGTHELQGIVDYEPTELMVTVRAGTPLRELEATLARHQQVLAFEPPHYGGRGSVGGAVATGLSGPRRAYAGALRDYMLGLQLIDGHGRLLRFGGRVIKNVAGFDVSRLIVGSMGTLGLITEVSLKTLPQPASEFTLVREADESTALQLCNQWAGQPLPVSATCHLQGRLHVRLSGAEAAVREARLRLGGEPLADADNFWRSLRNHEAPFFHTARPLWRISLPATQAQLGLPHPQLIEWGGALRWLSGELDATPLRQRLAALGGHLTRFRGTGEAPAFHPLSPGLANLHQRIKAAFDPAGILNRGHMLAGI